MTFPISPRVSERETLVSRLAVPTTRIFVAAVLLMTGTGVAAVFWKMPKHGEMHALYHEGVVDKELAAVPLPTEAVAALTHEEMEKISLPRLGMTPVADVGIGKYAQVYPAPALLTTAQTELNTVAEEEETFVPPVVPQRFEPLRQVIVEKPIFVERVDREFQPMPGSVSTAERSDDLMTAFHFVENSRATRESTPEQPADPFPTAVTSASASTLQTLQPLQLEAGRLSPLTPLPEIDLRAQ